MNGKVADERGCATVSRHLSSYLHTNLTNDQQTIFEEKSCAKSDAQTFQTVSSASLSQTYRSDVMSGQLPDYNTPEKAINNVILQSPNDTYWE